MAYWEDQAGKVVASCDLDVKVECVPNTGKDVVDTLTKATQGCDVRRRRAPTPAPPCRAGGLHEGPRGRVALRRRALPPDAQVLVMGSIELVMHKDRALGSVAQAVAKRCGNHVIIVKNFSAI